MKTKTPLSTSCQMINVLVTHSPHDRTFTATGRNCLSPTLHISLNYYSGVKYWSELELVRRCCYLAWLGTHKNNILLLLMSTAISTSARCLPFHLMVFIQISSPGYCNNLLLRYHPMWIWPENVNSTLFTVQIWRTRIKKVYKKSKISRNTIFQFCYRNLFVDKFQSLCCTN